MSFQFWWWVVLAAVLIVAEIFTTGFYLLPFGVGAAVAAVLQLAGFTLTWQIVIFIAVSAILLVSLRRFARHVTQESPEKVGSERFVGREAMVIEAVDPAIDKGRVRLQQEEWRASSATGDALPIGTMTVVVRVDGTRLVVRPVDEDAKKA